MWGFVTDIWEKSNFLDQLTQTEDISFNHF